MMNDELAGDDLLRGRVAFTRAEEMANLLGRIEATLIDSRKLFSRVAAGVALGLLIPALSAVNDAHAWFNTVNATIFPRK